MGTVNLGRVRVVPRGAWNSGTTYTILDQVTGPDGSYLAIQNVPAGTALTNAAFWQVVALNGINGADGAAGADGVNGADGAAGADGVNGADGADGANGLDGKTVLSGSGAPSAGLGTNGDFYINTAAFTIYGPKAAGAWGSPTNLIGPPGTTSWDDLDDKPTEFPPTDHGHSDATTAASGFMSGTDKAKLDAMVRPLAAFGAVGDGVTDDTTAVLAAMNHVGTVDWGNGIYRITSPISITRTAAIRWVSYGARILYDGATAQRAVQIQMAGFSFTLDGDLVCDANAKAFIGLYIENALSGPRPTFAATGLRVQNVYRSSTAFSGGDGCWIRGGWRTIYLERFSASNCRMAAGAGIPGSQGIFGLTISANSDTVLPDEITIVAPEISEIYSEDLTYDADQDGIRIFTAEDSATDPMPWPTHFTVVGGRFPNCRNRSIKSQCELGLIPGAKFVRDAGWTSGGLPTVGGYEVDFQVGGGFLIDCEYHYRDYAPQALVGFSGTRETGGIDRLSSGGTLRGAKVFLHNTPQMARLVQVSPFAADDFAVTIDDVQVISTAALVDYVAQASLTDTVGNENISIKNFRGKLATGFVNLTGGGGTAIVNLHLEDSINLAAAVPVHNATSNTVNLFCRGLLGATDATQSRQSNSRYTISVAGSDVAFFDSNSFDLFDMSLSDLSHLMNVGEAGEVGLFGFSGGGLRYAFDTRGATGVELFSNAFPITISAGAGDGVNFLVNGGSLAARLEADLTAEFFGPVSLAAIADPAPPSSGLLLYAGSYATRILPKIIGPAGLDTALQVGLHGNSVVLISPTSGTATLNIMGGTITTAGTLSAQFTANSTNRWTSTFRKRFRTATTVGNTASARTAYHQWFRGSAAGFGGFWFRAQFGQDVNLAGGQKFIGLCTLTGALAGEPSALLNMCGMGYDSTDSNTGNWFFLRNDGTGAATKVDLGANAPRTDQVGYDLMMFLPQGSSSTLYVRIVNLNTGALVLDTSYTTDLPAANTGLCFKCDVRNGAVAASDGIELAKAYVEANY